jgi:hypothetical protein
LFAVDPHSGLSRIDLDFGVSGLQRAMPANAAGPGPRKMQAHKQAE